MTTNHVESHNGRKLAIERQALAEGKEIDEVHVRNIERFVWVGFLGVVPDVGEGRAGSHEGMAGGERLDFGLAAHAHELFVGHAGLFETARTRCQPGSSLKWWTKEEDEEEE